MKEVNKLIVVHKENNVKFCMVNHKDKVEYKIKVGREVVYSHWDFDIAVKEYEITRKGQIQGQSRAWTAAGGAEQPVLLPGA